MQSNTEIEPTSKRLLPQLLLSSVASSALKTLLHLVILFEALRFKLTKVQILREKTQRCQASLEPSVFVVIHQLMLELALNQLEDSSRLVERHKEMLSEATQPALLRPSFYLYTKKTQPSLAPVF